MASLSISAWLLQPISVLIGLAGLLIFYAASIRYRPHLRNVPGPFWASMTYIPKLLSVLRSDMHLQMVDLHRRYGPIVRIGPNHVSVGDPAAIDLIYSTGSGFRKSDSYTVFWAKYGPNYFIPTNFGCIDEEQHKQMVRPTVHAYSMANILRMEGLLDDCIITFQEEIRKRIASSTIGYAEMDLSQWLHYFAFDNVTSMTFSKDFGFMKAGSDVDGIIAAIEGRLKYNCFVSQWPIWHQYLLRNEIGSWIANWIPAFARMNTSAKIVELTRREVEQQAKEKSEGYVDMLNIWRAKGSHNGCPMTDGELVGAAVANVLAGSHSTAGAVRDLIYYLLQNPKYLARLKQEIEEAENLKGLDEIVTYHQAKDMPFFQACVKESMRVHPGFGMNLERVVPEPGAEIGGQFLPTGTVVGVNTWTVGRDLQTYGKDADKFRPERWLEVWEASASNDEAARNKLHQMETCFFNFNIGNRSCLGRYMALTVVNKLTIQLLREFEIEQVNPEKKLETKNLFFLLENKLYCRLREKAQK